MNWIKMLLWPLCAVCSFAEGEGGPPDTGGIDLQKLASGAAGGEVPKVKEEGSPPADDLPPVLDGDLPPLPENLPPAPGEEPPPPEEDPLDKITSESINVNQYPEAARKNVGMLRKKVQQLETIIKAYADKKLSYKKKDDGTYEVEAPLADAGEIEKLTEQIKQQEDRLGRYSLAETGAFRQTYLEPINTMLQSIHQTALGFADEADAQKEDFQKQIMAEVQQYAMLSPVERARQLRANHPDTASVLLPMFSQIDALNQKRVQALNNWKTEMKTLRETEAAQVHARDKAVKDQLKSAALAEAVKNGFFMLKKVEGTDERSVRFNQTVDQMHQQIQTFFDDPDPKVAAQAFVRAASAQYLLGLVGSYQKREKALLERLKALGDVSADIGSSGGDRSGGGKQIGKEMDAKTAVSEIFASQGI